MNYYGKASTRRLITCNLLLQDIANELIKYLDCTVICGKRGKKKQNMHFDSGASKVQWPDSNHNCADENENEIIDALSDAIDIGPYLTGKGIVGDKKSCGYMAGMFMLIAAQKGTNIRWGGDWDGDNDFTDQKFEDLVHFELVNGGVL